MRATGNTIFINAKLVLVDINADKHSIGIDPNRALCINCNLNGSCTELLSIHADIVVMDPPWYLNYYQLFFDRAAIMSALDTQIMCIMPPKFTRAKTESETVSSLSSVIPMKHHPLSLLPTKRSWTGLR